MFAELYFIVLVIAAVVAPPFFAPRAKEVLDGDTIIMRYLLSDYRVRLWGCDAPELRWSQPYAQESKDMLTDLVMNRPLRIQAVSMDRHLHRMVARIHVNGRCVTERMIENGGAWWYKRYAPKEKLLEHLENRARTKKRGLWALENPIAPWEWRKGDRYVVGTDS